MKVREDWGGVIRRLCLPIEAGGLGMSPESVRGLTIFQVRLLARESSRGSGLPLDPDRLEPEDREALEETLRAQRQYMDELRMHYTGRATLRELDGE